MELHKVKHRIPPTQTQVMSATQTPQVMDDSPFKMDFNVVRGHAPLIRHRTRHTRHTLPTNIGLSIPAPMVLAPEDLFTKHERCYHLKPGVAAYDGGGEGRNIVEQAMNEVLNNDTYIGFSHNTHTRSVYLIMCGDWKGIEDKSIGCEANPVPQGLAKTKTSARWKWHSLYIKN